MHTMLDKIEKTRLKALEINDAETRHYIIKAIAGLTVLYGRKYTADITIKIINDRIKRDIKQIIKKEKYELENFCECREEKYFCCAEK